MQELAEWNWRYEAKFGHVFLISAAGKSAPDILVALKRRQGSRHVHNHMRAVGTPRLKTLRASASLVPLAQGVGLCVRSTRSAPDLVQDNIMYKI